MLRKRRDALRQEREETKDERRERRETKKVKKLFNFGEESDLLQSQEDAPPVNIPKPPFEPKTRK